MQSAPPRPRRRGVLAAPATFNNTLPTSRYAGGELGTSVQHNGNSPVFVDAFAGCGGLSLGLLRAGWKGLFAIEKDAFAFETLKVNLIDDGARHRYAWPEWLE